MKDLHLHLLQCSGLSNINTHTLEKDLNVHKTQNMKQDKLEIEQQGEINDANKSLTARLYVFRKSTLVTK